MKETQLRPLPRSQEELPALLCQTEKRLLRNEFTIALTLSLSSSYLVHPEVF